MKVWRSIQKEAAQWPIRKHNISTPNPVVRFNNVVAVHDDTRQTGACGITLVAALSRSPPSHMSPCRLRHRTSINLPSLMPSATALRLPARPSTLTATSLLNVLHMVPPPMFHQVVIPREPVRALSFALRPRTVQVLRVVRALFVAGQIGFAGE